MWFPQTWGHVLCSTIILISTKFVDFSHKNILLPTGLLNEWVKWGRLHSISHNHASTIGHNSLLEFGILGWRCGKKIQIIQNLGEGWGQKNVSTLLLPQTFNWISHKQIFPVPSTILACKSSAQVGKWTRKFSFPAYLQYIWKKAIFQMWFTHLLSFGIINIQLWARRSNGCKKMTMWPWPSNDSSTITVTHFTFDWLAESTRDDC